ncbi:MAG: cobyrinate a,c-diamide synthase [Candidatus Methanomethylophilaceae archaeon]|nr:cobyrinate a,c-diamide synthase [Candidatus Methanomethylophilaceae archaeon]NLF33934.1 cobyrinate a,c-diamide synthase [Thermoplasmatales archaeon]
MRLPRIMIAAPSSGSGKTLVTCGILQALVDRGLTVSSFKCGPDYIDPMFHSRVIGTKSRNLDTFFTDAGTTGYLFGRAAEGSDVSVIEGVMGFYDGLGGTSTAGSAHDLSLMLDVPVILVVDCMGMGLSVAALIKGFKEFRENNIKGVVLNNMPPSIYKENRDVIESELGLNVLGYVPNVKELVLESRHLGLVLPSEVEGLREKLRSLGRVLEETLDLDSLLEISKSAPGLDFTRRREKHAGEARIAVACDEAFCFIYEDNLAILEEMGAEIVRFSPLHDEHVPEADGMILYGGYPELYAGALSANVSMLKEIREKIEAGMPCMAECGGFMYLHEELEDAEGVSHPMVGAVKGRTFNKGRLSRFGYVSLEAGHDMLGFGEGDVARGHEFHYWDSTNCGGDLTATKTRGTRYACVHGTDTLLAGFPHLYYYSNPEVPYRFLRRCAERRGK